MNKSLGIILFISNIMVNSCNVTQAREIWVSPDGASSGDGSVSNPYDITTACQEKIEPGDTVMVKEGTHRIMEEIVITRSGTEEKPIHIISADGKHKAVIEIVESHDMGFLVKKASYIIFDGFKFIGGDRGYCIDGWDEGGNYNPCKGIVIRNSIGDGKQDDFIKVTWADNILIENNEFFGCKDEQVDLIGTWGGIVRNNVFRDFPDPYGQTCLQVKGGSKDVIIEKNLFYNVKEKTVRLGSYTDDQYIRPLPGAPAKLEAMNLTLRNNIFYKCPGCIAVRSCHGAQIYNNTTWKRGSIWKEYILWAEAPGETKDVKIWNNIVVATNIGKLVDHALDADQGFEGKNNIFWDGDGSIGWGDIPSSRYMNTIQLDPLLKDPEKGDFHLLSESPAVDAGVYLPDLKEDYEGIPRPQGNGFDIGAFEFKPDDKSEDNEKPDDKSEDNEKSDETLICYPNPSVGGEEITFEVKENRVIKIFSLSGKLIKQITGAPWKWDLKNDDNREVASGIYIYVIIHNEKIETRGKLGIIR